MEALGFILILNAKAYYRPKDLPKGIKLTAEASKRSWNKAFAESTKLRFEHKGNHELTSYRYSLQWLMVKHVGLHWDEANFKLTPKVSSGSATFSGKKSAKAGTNFKLNRSLPLNSAATLKCGFDIDLKKNGLSYGGNVKADYKLPSVALEWRGYQGQLTHLTSCGFSLKSDGLYKVDSKYCAHLLTKDKHRLYFEHSVAYDSKNANKVSNSVTFNGQDSDGIGTFNANI